MRPRKVIEGNRQVLKERKCGRGELTDIGKVAYVGVTVLESYSRRGRKVLREK